VLQSERLVLVASQVSSRWPSSFRLQGLKHTLTRAFSAPITRLRTAHLCRAPSAQNKEGGRAKDSRTSGRHTNCAGSTAQRR